MHKTAVILVNVGTPDSPGVRAVRPYLREFLSDPRVIDIPFIPRWLLVNLIIAPFRAPRSSKKYKLLWTSEGSPLLIHLESLAAKLNSKAEGGIRFFAAMRYGKPSLRKILWDPELKKYDAISILPLFPQYASSTSGSIMELVMKEVSRWGTIPNLKIMQSFHRHPAFLKVFANKINSCEPSSFDHIVFSYHGLPLSHIARIHPEVLPAECQCRQELVSHGSHCYLSACYETTRLLTSMLNLKPGTWSVGFQSRLTKNWLSPFTDELLVKLARSGKKKVLVVAPSFVADCLETSVEIGLEYRELFIHSGGHDLQLLGSLNDSDDWVDAVLEIIRTPPPCN